MVKNNATHFKNTDAKKKVTKHEQSIFNMFPEESEFKKINGYQTALK